MRTIFGLAAAALALGVIAPANAVTTITAVINTATLTPFALNTVAITPVTLGVGDTFDLTLTFSGGPLTLLGGGGLWSGLLESSGPSATIFTDSVLSFTGASSNITGGGPLNQDNSFAHVGSYFSAAFYQTAPGDIGFTSIRQVVTLVSDDIGASREYAEAFFYYETRVVPGVIPEPASWALLIAGFGMVGAAARRRRAAVAA